MTEDVVHPAPERLEAYGSGLLEPREHLAIESHVLECDSCWRALSDGGDEPFVLLLRTSWDETREAADDDDGHRVAEEEAGRDVRPLEALTDPVAGDDRVVARLSDHPRYRILGRCGEGGMGVVYRAEHRLMRREVALKVIRPDLVRKANAVERFRRESRAAASLSHPNIVSAFDAEEANGLHFLVMEYVAGHDLATEVARRGALPVQEACDYVRQAAFGLAHAHERGMVHRDIKPQNLMLTSDGCIKILDFGLSKFVSEASACVPSSSSTAVHTSELTHASMTLGTPDYVAPEQAAHAGAADIRGDIYALGGTLYFLLAGRSPFAGQSVAEKLLSQSERDPLPLSNFRDDVPPQLVSLLRRMTAKRPDDRVQSPAEVAREIERFLMIDVASEVGGRQEPAQARRRSLRPAILTGVSFAAVAALGIALYISFREGTVAIESDVPNVRIVVEQDGQSVAIIDPVMRREANLKAGDYTVRLSGGASGLTIVRPGNGSFALRSGETEIIRVRRTGGAGRDSVDPVAALRAEGAKLSRTPEGGISVDIRGMPSFTDEKIDLVTRLPGVTDLTLEDVPVTDAGLERLRPLTGLRRLILNESDVTGKGLATLAALPLRRGLYSLGLRGLKVTDADLPPLKRFSSLNRLDLSGTSITGAGLAALDGSNLRVFDVRRTQVAEAEAAAFSHANPQTALER